MAVPTLSGRPRRPETAVPTPSTWRSPDPTPRPYRRSVAGGTAPVRTVIWAGHLALPLAGLWLLIAQPRVDLVWQNNPAHFWLVGAVALGNVVLAVLIDRAAVRRRDARLLLVALAFLAGAGFLGLHALATPEVLMTTGAGFVLATPLGLLVSGLFAVASAVRYAPGRAERVVRRRPVLRV